MLYSFSLFLSFTLNNEFQNYKNIIICLFMFCMSFPIIFIGSFVSPQEVVLAPEAEGMVESLRGFPLDEIGTPAWYRQHEYVEKLNMQAVVSASNQRDEFVKEFLINHAKLDLIVRDLITTSVWVEKVFPQLSEMNYEPPSSFSIYLILYHEATLINLLETVLYHQVSTCRCALQ